MNEHVLIVCAHIDDETLGVGGTILKHVHNGDIVHVLVITDSCSTQYPSNNSIMKEKHLEADKAMHILGVKSIEFNSLPDMQLDTVPHVEINKIIEDKIKRYKPTIVYTHHWGDINKDHRLVSEATMIATRPTQEQTVKKVYTYEVPSSTEWNVEPYKTFTPNTYVDITAFMPILDEVVKCYKTELRRYPHPRSVEGVKYTKNGIPVGIKYVERFCLVRSIE